MPPTLDSTRPILDLLSTTLCKQRWRVEQRRARLDIPSSLSVFHWSAPLSSGCGGFVLDLKQLAHPHQHDEVDEVLFSPARALFPKLLVLLVACEALSASQTADQVVFIELCNQGDTRELKKAGKRAYQQHSYYRI